MVGAGRRSHPYYLSLAHIKETSYEQARRKICQTLSDLYSEYNFLLHESILDEKEE